MQLDSPFMPSQMANGHGCLWTCQPLLASSFRPSASPLLYTHLDRAGSAQKPQREKVVMRTVTLFQTAKEKREDRVGKEGRRRDQHQPRTATPRFLASGIFYLDPPAQESRTCLWTSQHFVHHGEKRGGQTRRRKVESGRAGAEEGRGEVWREG